MTQYINKDAVVAEIGRRLSLISQNTNAYEEGRKRTYLAVLALINTLEVKEVQEEPVCEDLEEIAWNHADKKCHLDIAVFTPDEVKKERGKMQFTWQDLYDAVMFGAQSQKAKDQSTIELAEDHAMLAGMEKMKEQMMAKAVETTFNVSLPSGLYDKLWIKGCKECDKLLVIKKDEL